MLQVPSERSRQGRVARGVRVVALGFAVLGLAVHFPPADVAAQTRDRDRTSRSGDSRRPGVDRSGDSSRSPARSRPTPRPGTTATPDDTSAGPDASSVPSSTEAGGAAPADEAAGGWKNWIIGSAAALGVLALVWIFLARRRGDARQDYLEELDTEESTQGMRKTGSRSRGGYSSTRIRARDVESRLSDALEGSTVETDQEYALVVEEDALLVGADAVDDSTGKSYAFDADIREAIAEGDFDRAFELYESNISDDGSLEFRADIEHRMSDHYLTRRDLEKATYILEHHVATHAQRDVRPEVFFNLGYAHVLRGTLNKSRRFLRLFIDSGSNAQHVARARGILDRLETKS